MFVFAATVAVLTNSFRQWAFQIIGWIWLKLTRHDIKPTLDSFEDSFQKGANVIRKNPRVLASPIGLIAGDWIANIISLWFCFNALKISIDPGVLLTGFVLGITAGAISLLPGGFGSQDLSMVGIYVTFGVPFASAVLAIIFFRVVYYFVPFLVSLGFYRRLLREIDTDED